MNTRNPDALEPKGFTTTQAECYGCDLVTEVDDMTLCSECASKLDRDMIRLRDWDRSMTAWTTPKDKRESLRDEIIKKHGTHLELISVEESSSSKATKKRRKKR